jgi:hypothetical protein
MPRLPDMSRLLARDEGGVNSQPAEAGVNDVAGHGGERNLECQANVVAGTPRYRRPALVQPSLDSAALTLNFSSACSARANSIF